MVKQDNFGLTIWREQNLIYLLGNPRGSINSQVVTKYITHNNELDVDKLNSTVPPHLAKLCY